MISYNLHNPSKSLADRLYTAEFDDALVDQIAWKNARYDGCKVTSKKINTYTPKQLASDSATGVGYAFIAQPGIGLAGGQDGSILGMEIGATGPSGFTIGGYYTSAGSPPHTPSNQPGVFQVNNFPPKVLWKGDTLNPMGLVPNLKNETTALYISNTVVGGQEDSQFASIKAHSYISIDKILLINPHTDQVQIIEKHAEDFLPFHQFVTNDFPTGGNFTVKVIEEGISHNLKGPNQYKTKMNKGWLLKSFSFSYDKEAPQLTENNSMYLYRSGSVKEGTIAIDNSTSGKDPGESISGTVTGVNNNNRIRFRYGVIEMFSKSYSSFTGYVGHHLQRENIGPSFKNAQIIENKFTKQYYSGSFGSVDEPSQPQGTHNRDIIRTSGLGSASRFIGQNSLEYLISNNNDDTLTEQEKTELHITFFQGTKDFAPGANDERSISTFEVDRNQEQLGVGDNCHDYLPKNHELVLKGHNDSRFEPVFTTYEDSFFNAYSIVDTSQVNGCVQVNQLTPAIANTEIQLGINVDEFQDIRVYVQGGAIGQEGYISVSSASAGSSVYGRSNLTHEDGPLFGSVSASDHFYSGSFSYELSWLDKDHVLIANLDKEAELFNGIGDQGIIVIPEHIHPKITNNINYYLQQAGLGSGNAPNTITKLDDDTK